MAIWGSEVGKDIIAECVRAHKVINALLLSPSHDITKGPSVERDGHPAVRRDPTPQIEARVRQDDGTVGGVCPDDGTVGHMAWETAPLVGSCLAPPPPFSWPVRLRRRRVKSNWNSSLKDWRLRYLAKARAEQPRLAEDLQSCMTSPQRG